MSMNINEICPIHGYQCIPVVKQFGDKMYCGRCGLPLVEHTDDALDLLLLEMRENNGMS